MTFVAAKRFRDRVLIAADTMISDVSGTRSNAIPGRLKVVILDSKNTIAYAGLANQALDSIRSAKRCLSEGGENADVEQLLSEAAMRHWGALEFLLVTHSGGVALKRIWEDRISDSLSQTCIGQRSLLDDLLAQESVAPELLVPSEFEDEVPFSFAFAKLFTGIYVSEGVGGFGVLATCSPYGHHYNGTAGTFAWDTIVGGQPPSEQQLADQRSGMTQWAYHITGPRLRGVGVAGAMVLSAGVGFIYSPLEQDDPIKVTLPVPEDAKMSAMIQNIFQDELEKVAARVGGGVEVIFEPTPVRPPTQLELAEIGEYADCAVFPTKITLREKGLWISCGPLESEQGVLVDLHALSNDPVKVAKITIDRLNAAARSRYIS